MAIDRNSIWVAPVRGGRAEASATAKFRVGPQGSPRLGVTVPAVNNALMRRV
jgi:hypothetical protein